MKKPILSTVAAAALLAGTASAEELVVWHDLGENGIAWFQQLSDLYAKENPDVTVTSINYPTEQWFSKSIAALNTDTAPDLLYNNYERVIRVENQTDKILDLASYLPADAKEYLSEADLQVATYEGKMIIFPIQRVQMAFGVRTSWLEAVDEEPPQTWDDVLRVAEKFTTGDPDGNGENDTFGIAIEAANPRDLIHMLDLYTFGTGLRHTLVDPEGNVVIDEPAHKKVLIEVMKLFTDYGYVAPDSVNHSFAEMYQVIEGGRAGMFRVGDWNVKKWDVEGIEGDFTIINWPAFEETDESAVVIGGMRGVAVPTNSPHQEDAIAFAQFMLSPEAQKASLANIGASVRSDFDMSDMGLSENRMVFADPQHNLNAYDFPESIHPWYPEVEAEYHKRLLDVIANPPEDWNAYVDQLAADMQAMVDEKQG